MSGFRLPEGGEAIDRSRPLSFTFDGTRLEGLAGDTVASALLANGVRVVGRSFKYHRPRGVFGGWVEEPNAHLDCRLDGRTSPNVRATTEPLAAGMALSAVNARPTAARDRAGVLDRLWRFLPAGFYYKTFMWPSFARYESRIRAMAGLGRLDPDNHPPADCREVNATCDVLVVGAGPAGLAAARAAAAQGERVILLDDRAEAGGAFLHRGGTVDGEPWRAFAAAATAAVEAVGGRVLPRTVAYGVHGHGLVAAWQRRDDGPDVKWKLRPRRTVLATGAIERPLVFPDNDRPGIMSADAALAYLVRFAVAPARRVVVATVDDAAYPVAGALASAGVEVAAILDGRRDGLPATDLPVRAGALPTGTRGDGSGLSAVSVGGETIPAGALLVCGGFTPTVHLWGQAGGRLAHDGASDAFLPAGTVEGMTVAGAAAGAFGLAAALAGGEAAGEARPAPARPAPSGPSAAPSGFGEGGGRAWVDLQNDVTVSDVALAVREGFGAVEHLKRYTTLGMATDQGKTSNVAGIRALAAASGRPVADVGVTTFRPPFVPVPLTVIAGRRRGFLFDPVKRLAVEDRHRDAGATFREYGGWLRPAWYGPDGDDRAARAAIVAREVRAARTAVALFDASPLGRIEVIGPDAAALLDFNGYGRVSTLAPGRIRYGLMLQESGVVLDDGVVMRLAEDRFVVSASSAHADAIATRLEAWRQDRFDRKRVVVHDATHGFVTLAVTGPRARALLSAARIPVPDDDALPHMGHHRTELDGVPLEIARVSFTGERSYELSVPAASGRALFERLSAALPEVGGAPIGLEALLVLRAEKGYVIVGKDTDGLTMPHDLGMTGPRERRTDEYIGRRSLFLPEAMRADRRQLVGLAVPEGAPPLPVGAHALDQTASGRKSIGYVTTSHPSEAAGRPIALALVEAGRSRMGEAIDLYHLGTSLRATIAPATALDPDGRRLHA